MKGKIALFVFWPLVFLSGYTNASWWDAPDAYHGGIQVRTEQLISELQAGKKILFVDTREREEFEESHIPGATHLTLREVSEQSALDMAGYDYVVPYCLKDLRGYEVTRRLQEYGLSNVVMMEPPGLRGWQSLGLPLTNPHASDETVMELLRSVEF